MDDNPFDFGNNLKPPSRLGVPWGENSEQRQEREEKEREKYRERKRMFTAWDYEDRDFEYHDFKVTQNSKENTLIAIKTLDGSELPKGLEGLWTDRQKAVDAIDTYVIEKERAENGTEISQPVSE